MSQQTTLRELSLYNRLLIIGLLILSASCSSSDSSRENPEWETPPDPAEIKEKSIIESGDYDRTSWQNPALVIDKLGPISSKTVADIGAGMGYFTFLMAEKGAKVLAIDIEPEYISYIQELQEESQMYTRNMIETRLSEPGDPLLQPDEVDAVLIVNTYTFLPDRIQYLKKIDSGLKARGILCIVDYKSGGIPVISEDTPVVEISSVVKDLRQAGYHILETDTSSLAYQYIITATSEL